MKKPTTQVTPSELARIKRAAFLLLDEADFGSKLANFQFAFTTAAKQTLGDYSFSRLSPDEYQRIETTTRTYLWSRS
jgi:hypothetical protein